MQTTQQFRSWVNEASPDDLVEIGPAVLKRIAQLDQTYQRRFADTVKAEPSVTRLFEHISA